jgi:hypothetical protein
VTAAMAGSTWGGAKQLRRRRRAYCCFTSTDFEQDLLWFAIVLGRDRPETGEKIYPKKDEHEPNCDSGSHLDS